MRAPITMKGAQKLRDELDHLKSVKRPKVIAAIAEAREHGDLKENADTTPRARSRVSSKAASSSSKVSCRMRRSSM